MKFRIVSIPNGIYSDADHAPVRKASCVPRVRLPVFGRYIKNGAIYMVKVLYLRVRCIQLDSGS